jgi:hypothetical protein
MPSLSCAHSMPDDRKCKAPIIGGSKFCFFHDPEKKPQRDAARSSGGRKNRPAALPPGSPSIQLRTSDEVMALIEASVNEVRRGEIDPKVANAIACLISLQIRLLDHRLEERMAALERIVGSRSREKAEPIIDGTDPLASLETFQETDHGH